MKPITVRLPEKVAIEFKNLSNKFSCNQAELIEILLNEYNNNHNPPAYNVTESDLYGLTFYASYDNSLDDNPMNNQLPDRVDFRGKIVYSDLTERAPKDANIYAETLQEDYGLDTHAHKYLISNTVTIAQSDVKEDSSKPAFIVYESICVRSSNNEPVVQNSWYQFANTASDVIPLLSSYVDALQRSAIKTGLADRTNCKISTKFIPTTVLNKTNLVKKKEDK